MRVLKPLPEIPVPPPQPEQVYTLCVHGRTYRFQGLKRLLGAADYSKAGDRHAGLAADSELTREAARTILSGLPLSHLYEHPLTDSQGRIDAVMRVNYDIDLAAFSALAGLTVGELKEKLLAAPPAQVAQVGAALTGVMAAALVRLCDTHELLFLARKLCRPTRARTLLGAAGTLSSRLQPNHPTDDPRGLTLLFYAGLAVGAGDALLGVNPAVDTVDNVAAVLRLLDSLRRQAGVPTQICCLGHLKTQLQCLELGAPVEIMFQSLAGTEDTLVSEFDVTVELLDSAYRTMEARGPLAGTAQQFMYFETGQGSEFTYGKHHGIDMSTSEALCYGLARRYDPFMVNNVTGFIGPETHLDNFEMIISNLQDHLMGKLLGLPMGMAPCYTLHSHITLEGQQMATALLAAAGANYYMDVHLNTDRMLAYFDTSGHDVQTLREVHARKPAAEYLAWALERGIFAQDRDGTIRRGAAWGDPRPFLSQSELRTLAAATPALYGFGTAGPRAAEAVTRLARLNQAIARDAIYRELDVAQLQALAPFRIVRTAAGSKEAHLHSPDLGARLHESSLRALQAETATVQIVVSDGLSAAAVHHNVPQLLPVLLDGLRGQGVTVGQPILAPYGRVKLAEQLAEQLDAALVIYLIGERPGGDAQSSCSLSAYLVYHLKTAAAQADAARTSGNPTIRFEYSVLSNIYESGLPPIEAGAVLLEKIHDILSHKAAGNRLTIKKTSPDSH